MSGTQSFQVSGIAIAAVNATVVGLNLLAAAAGVAVELTGKAINAYQERVRQQREAAEKREREIQQRIADIRAQIRSRGSQAKVTVKLPPETQFQGTVSRESTKTADQRDQQRKINDLNSRLPNIRTEYQALIAQQLLDHSTVDQALEKTQQALNSNNLAQAQGYLQALDDARVEVMKRLRDQRLEQIKYLEERLEEVRNRIPHAIAIELQDKINQANNNWQPLSDGEIEALHQQISAFESQADSIQEAAKKLVESWLQVGYQSYFAGIDNGDAIVEIETHEGVNTQMRIEFYGDRMNLDGPPGESNSCAARTVDALRLFREQGYQLQWTEWDGEPVAEDLRHLYSVPSEDISENTGEIEADSRSRRRRESQGY
jgi:hypothetical protein